jgi:hypothetical protein
MDLRKEIERLHETSKEIVNGTKDEIYPAFLAELPTGELTMFSTPWGSTEEKEKILATMRGIFAIRGVTKYITFSEAWRAAYDKNAILPGQPGARRPSQREDREEVINYIGISHDENVAAFCVIDRHPDGTRSCQPLEFYDSGPEFGGQFTELLPPPDLVTPPVELQDALIEKFLSMVGSGMADFKDIMRDKLN